MESGGQDQTDQHQSGKDQEGAERAENVPAKHDVKMMTAPSAGTLNPEFLLPVSQDQMLQIQKGGPTQYKDKRPPGSDPQIWLMEKLGNPETHQGHGSKIGGSTEEKVGNVCNHSPDTPHEIQRGGVDWNMGPESPGGDVSWIKRTKRQQQKDSPEKEENPGHLVHGATSGWKHRCILQEPHGSWQPCALFG